MAYLNSALGLSALGSWYVTPRAAWTQPRAQTSSGAVGRLGVADRGADLDRETASLVAPKSVARDVIENVDACPAGELFDGDVSVRNPLGVRKLRASRVMTRRESEPCYVMSH